MNSLSDNIVQPPLMVRRLFQKDIVWRAEVNERKVFLTFDDGPVPGITPWVLKLLGKYDIKATFFCVGDNVRKYPRIYTQLQGEGHETAIHGFFHKPAHKMNKYEFEEDLNRSLELNSSARWYRPPHGIIFPWWVPIIKKYHLNIAMWDVLSRDYDRSLNPEIVTHNVLSKMRQGSLIVFHDSLKAWPNLKEALPKVLSWIKKSGYQADILSSLKSK